MNLLDLDIIIRQLNDTLAALEKMRAEEAKSYEPKSHPFPAKDFDGNPLTPPRDTSGDHWENPPRPKGDAEFQRACREAFPPDLPYRPYTPF